MKKKTIILALIVLVLSIGLTSCSILGEATGKSKIIDNHTFIDDDGNEFTIDKDTDYKRIISLYSAHTENLYALGVGDRIIGVNTTSIYPAEAAFLPRYDYKSDPEPLIAAKPDLVIIRPFLRRNYPEYISALEKAGIKVVSLYPVTSEEFEKYITILSMVTGTEDEGKKQLALLDERIESIHNKVKDIKEEDKENVYFESTKTDYRTVTEDSNPGRAIVTAGGINIAAGAKAIEKGSSIADFGIEKIMMNADKIDLYVSQRGAMNSGESALGIPQREGFMSVKAVKEGRILELNEKIISSPTFRYYKGVNEIARALYPDIMDNYDDLKSDNPITREDYAILSVKIDHSPIFIPSSSHYYETEYYTHTYGMFKDVKWTDENFDFIETSVLHSFLKSHRDKNDNEYFDKDELVTREEVADTVNILVDLDTVSDGSSIADLDQCENGRVVSKVVDAGYMELNNGKFEPNKTITANEAIKILTKAKEDKEKNKES